MKRITVNPATVATSEVAALFHKPEILTTWIQPSDIENAKTQLIATSQVITLLEDKADKVHEYSFRQFIEYDSQELANLLNKMNALDELLQVVVGQLSYKLRIRKNSEFNQFEQHKVAPVTAFIILQALIEVGVIQTQTKVISELNETTGKKVWRTQTIINFGHTIPENDLYIHGLTLEPCILQGSTKVRPGGKSVKLSGKEKLFLKNAGATPLRLIALDPTVLETYMKQSPWYMSVLNGDVNMDPIIANALIKKQVAKFTLMQKLESFYLPVWIDYRTRLYYEITELGFNPHGKQFETSLYELAQPRLIDADGYDALAYSAATIIDGRLPHWEAIQRFTANPSHYLAALKTPSDDMGETLYNARLAQAIEDYYSGTPSHFLLGEDATNGGLQHGGIGFKEPAMMLPANVGGSTRQEDSHQNLGDSLGLSREEAKPFNTQLLHGQSILATAKQLSKTVADTKAMLKSAYGNGFFNIETIANWGTQVVDNNNTTLTWTTLDGFKAQSIAYTESVPLTIYAFSSSTKTGYTQIKIHRDMPLLLDRKGQPIYGNVGDDKSMGKSNKLRGLYANITHSIDATGLRTVIRAVMHSSTEEHRGGVWKHDNFLTHPNDMKTVRHAYKQALLAEFDASLYESAMNQIVANFNGTKPLVPTLVVGNATKDMIEQSHYYLAS